MILTAHYTPDSKTRCPFHVLARRHHAVHFAGWGSVGAKTGAGYIEDSAGDDPPRLATGVHINGREFIVLVQDALPPFRAVNSEPELFTRIGELAQSATEHRSARYNNVESD